MEKLDRKSIKEISRIASFVFLKSILFHASSISFIALCIKIIMNTAIEVSSKFAYFLAAKKQKKTKKNVSGHFSVTGSF